MSPLNRSAPKCDTFESPCPNSDSATAIAPRVSLFSIIFSTPILPHSLILSLPSVSVLFLCSFLHYLLYLWFLHYPLLLIWYALLESRSIRNNISTLTTFPRQGQGCVHITFSGLHLWDYTLGILLLTEMTQEKRPILLKLLTTTIYT